MLTLIHAADLHLDSPFRGLPGELAAQRRREQRELLGRLAGLAREREAALVLLAGDLFDGGRLYRETREAVAAALGQIPCPVFIAPGNHDPAGADSPYRTMPWPENVHIFLREEAEAVALPELGCVVHGTAFTSSGRETDPLEGLAVPVDGLLHIMVAHGEVAGRAGGTGRGYGPIGPESIARSGLDYLALGHIHAGTGLQWAGKTPWAYPGCPEGRGFDECGEKGVLVCRLERGRAEAEFVPLCGRRYERLEAPLEQGTDPAEAARAALEGHEADICRLDFTGAVHMPPDLPSLERELAGRCFALSLRDHTSLARDLWARAEEDSLTGLFLRSVRERLAEAETGEDRALLELAARFGLSALEQGEDCRP